MEPLSKEELRAFKTAAALAGFIVGFILVAAGVALGAWML